MSKYNQNGNLDPMYIDMVFSNSCFLVNTHNILNGYRFQGATLGIEGEA